MLLLQHGRVAFPLLFQLLGKVVVFQNRTRCLLVFLAVGEGNGVEKSDAALLVSIGVGQKSDGQSAAAGRQALIALKGLAELFRQHGKGFFFIQPGIAPCGQLRGRQAIFQGLFRRERFPLFIEQ